MREWKMENNKTDNIAKQAERPGMDIYDWVLIARELAPSITSIISVLGCIWLFAFSNVSPERMNTLAVFLGGGSMAQFASPYALKGKKK
jgi:hypothetical protein